MAALTARSNRNLPELGQAACLMLVGLIGLGILGMHGLTSVGDAAHGHDPAASRAAADHSSHPPRGEHDKAPRDSGWHDVVLCIWLLAGGVAVVSLSRTTIRSLRSPRWNLPRLMRLPHWAQRDPPTDLALASMTVLRR